MEGESEAEEEEDEGLRESLMAESTTEREREIGLID
uniref:Uncharacterized protein n=1 Tax=Rhizophora mucronata TaxID=61149 RepID=A0A2P2QZQ1_RHIMU